MRIIYISIVIFIVALANSFAASISLFDINASKFPEMSAKLFVLDDKGENISGLSKEQIQLDENGVMRNLSLLDCPIPKPPVAISAVLTIDVSGSMSGEGIFMASAAAKVFVNTLPLGKSEAAITSFDSYNYLNCDFTRDRTKLITAIDQLRPNGGTDFDAGLIQPMFGSLILAEKGQHKRVVIFLTDGFASGHENEIVKKANALNAVIYCVVIGQKAPEILKNIAKRTGGEYFENIRTAPDAEKCYKDILNKAQGGEPCTIRWTSGGCPDNRKLTVSVPYLNLNTFDYYSVDFSLLPKLSILPGESIRFGGLEPGTFLNKKVKILNGKEVVRIDSITGTHPHFKILDFPSSGITLEPSQSIEFSLQFRPFDSAYKFSRFTVHSNACSGTFFYASGGFHGAKTTLEVTSPNGGEKYQAGLDTLITWGGIPASDTVKIELSTDGGFTWRVLNNKGSNLKNSFIPPNIESEKCLVRIKQLESMGSRQNSFRVHTFTAKSLSISPDAKFVATSGEERNFNIYDINTGKLVRNVSSSLVYKKVKFSPDGQYLAVSVSDYSIEIYATSNWSIAKKISGKNNWIEDFAFSGDSKYLATTPDDRNSNRIRIINLSDNKTVYSNSYHNSTINKIISSPDGKKIISTSDDGTIKIWDISNGNEIKTITGASSYNAIAISPEGSRITVSANNNQELRTYDVNSSVLLNTKSTDNDKYSDIAYSNDGQSIAVSTQKGYLHFYSADNYDSLRSMRINTFIINDIEWSSDSKYLAVITNEGNMHLLNFEIILQEDVSDDFFSISKAKYSTSNINFPTQRIGIAKDSIFLNAFRNNSSFPLIIKGRRFVAGDSSVFTYVSGLDTVPSNSSAKIEIRFAPKIAKSYSATLRLFTSADSTDIKITGDANAPFFTNYNQFLDFGKVTVDFPKDTLFYVFKNNTDKTINIKKVKIIGPEKKAFTIRGNYAKNIQSGAEYNIPLSFIPLEKGMANTIVLLYSDYESDPVQIQLLGEGISECGASSFNKPKITELKEINLIADAYFSDSLLVLNQAKDRSIGGFRLSNLIPIDSGFSMSFKFSITDPYQFSPVEYSYPGADGISVVLHNSNDLRRLGGGGMGFEGMHNALAIELDLFSNDANQIENYNDPNGNHLAVFRIPAGDSVLTSYHKPNNVLAMNKDIPIVRSDGTAYFMKLEYNQAISQLSIFLDSTGDFKSPAIKIDNFKIQDFIKLYDERGAFISIFGVSGSSYQSHKLHSLRLCTYRNSLPVYSSIQYSDNSNDFKVIHNTKSQTLEISTETYSKIAKLNIINELGITIQSNQLDFSNNNSISIQLNSIPHGFYLIKIEYENKHFLQKLIR